MIQEESGLPISSSSDIPEVMITDSASMSSMNGHTRTARRRDAATALDLLKSETKRWRADAAHETSMMTNAGSQSHFNTSSEVSSGMEPLNTNQEM